MFAVNQFLFALFAGLAAGCIHVLSGPDHLAAIAPLSLGRKVRTWMIGARWGLGHASGVLFVGLLSLMIREIIPLESVSSWAERLVGVALIGIGLWGLRKAFSTRLHLHEHSHGGETMLSCPIIIAYSRCDDLHSRSLIKDSFAFTRPVSP